MYFAPHHAIATDAESAQVKIIILSANKNHLLQTENLAGYDWSSLYARDKECAGFKITTFDFFMHKTAFIAKELFLKYEKIWSRKIDPVGN